jgi:predicted nucleic acid-binding protein
MNAVDTNVLLYLVDQDEPTKQSRATVLLEGLADADKQPVLLWQVAVEFVAGLKRRENLGKATAQDTWSHWQRAQALFPLVFPRSNLIPVAFDLVNRYSLSFWDALLLAACLEAGVDTLYSEDLSHEATYDTVKVVNPFV